MRLFLLLGLAVAVACGEPLGLPQAAAPNVVDTVSLYALTGTPVATPSGYQVQTGDPIRTDQSTAFDFVFEIDTAGRAVLLPTGALGLGRASGVQLSRLPFDSIRIAPDRGYQLDSAVVIAADSIAIVQSRPVTCEFGIPAFYYAKLRVLLVDPIERRLDFEILTDQNCGYRGLEPGLPTR